MAHVLMVGAGAHGHTHPHLPVIAELVARGHRVTYAIPAPFAEMVAATGATPLVHTSVLPDQSARRAVAERPRRRHRAVPRRGGAHVAADRGGAG